MSNLVIIKDNQAVTTSRMVATAFGKQHQHVIRDIKTLGASKEFNASNFGLVTYIDAKGQSRPEFEIKRDGFTILAMGYTGSTAMRFKEAYIKAFNEMENTIKQPVVLENKYSIEDLIIAQATSIKELKAEVEAIKLATSLPIYEESPLELMSGQQQLFPTDKLIKVSEYALPNYINLKSVQELGRIAAKFSKETGLSFEKHPNGNRYQPKAIEHAISFLKLNGTGESIVKTPNFVSPDLNKIIEQLKKNPLAQELKGISIGVSKSYRSYLYSTLKNLVYLKIHKCSSLRFSIRNTSRGWVKVRRIN